MSVVRRRAAVYNDPNPANALETRPIKKQRVLLNEKDLSILKGLSEVDLRQLDPVNMSTTKQLFDNGLLEQPCYVRPLCPIVETVHGLCHNPIMQAVLVVLKDVQKFALREEEKNAPLEVLYKKFYNEIKLVEGIIVMAMKTNTFFGTAVPIGGLKLRRFALTDVAYAFTNPLLVWYNRLCVEIKLQLRRALLHKGVNIPMPNVMMHFHSFSEKTPETVVCPTCINWNKMFEAVRLHHLYATEEGTLKTKI